MLSAISTRDRFARVDITVTLVRRGAGIDIPFMRALVNHAYNWHASFSDADVPLSRYLDGWGRPGDTVIIAIERGHRVAAGWFRMFSESAPGYGFVDNRTPELTVAAIPSYSDDVTIQLLLTTLLERAMTEGYAGVSVSLEPDDPHLAVYKASGFERVDANGLAVSMRCNLT